MNYRDPWGEDVYYSDLGGSHSLLVYSDSNSSTGYRKFGFEGEGAGYPEDSNSRAVNFTRGSKSLLTKGVPQSENVRSIYKDHEQFFKLDLFCGEEDKLRDAVDNYKAGLYCLPFRNCSHVVRDVLNQSGFLSSPNGKLMPRGPEGLTKELLERNNARKARMKWKKIVMQKINRMRAK